jgi:3-phosphoshikimate 1-carboxyvinyltransferase
LQNCAFQNQPPNPMPSPLPELYKVRPFTKPANARVRVPGSKSITNRALAIGAVLGNQTRILGALRSRDTEIMQQALNVLGRTTAYAANSSLDNNSHQPEYLIKKRTGKNIFPVKKATIHVGNAGTVARFLTAILALQKGGEYKVDGDEAIYSRPMIGLTDALASLGVTFEFHKEDGCVPFTMNTPGVKGGKVTVDASASSQILSALLIMGVGTPHPLEIELDGETVSKPFVEMTLKMVERVVGTIAATNGIYRINGGPKKLKSPLFRVEPDATASSYFTSLPIIKEGSEVQVRDLNYCELQGDIAYLQVLTNAGLITQGGGADDNQQYDEENPPDYVISSLPSNVTPHGVRADFEAFSDTFLTLAALTPLLEGTTRIDGIAHTRRQETDRVAGMATELKKLGQHVIEEEGSLEITPDIEALKSIARKAREDVKNGIGSGCVEIDTYHDHRFAMSFAILGCRDLLGDGLPWLAIRDPKCCGKTFPNFFDVLEDAWAQSHRETHITANA